MPCADAKLNQTRLKNAERTVTLLLALYINLLLETERKTLISSYKLSIQTTKKYVIN